MDSRDRVEQLLYANVQNNANPNPPALTAVLNQVRPLAPPTLTYLDLLTANIADFRNLRQFDGKKVYLYACILRAQNQRLSLTRNTISIMAERLWNNSEPDNIKQAYKDIAGEAARIYSIHHRQVSSEHNIIHPTFFEPDLIFYIYSLTSIYRYFDIPIKKLDISINFIFQLYF
ncbi:hypothetical protein C1646_262442 [Rhizophagus diaphanus]|nr:hypothetical protein C1646_262442 [Rhizophagus diaphanus] [Rhizophagus sp. MUCL 43196]